MKVWVLTKGEYSSYRIVGIFSSEEKVREAKAMREMVEDNEPVEYDLDQIVGWEHGPKFQVMISKETGETRVKFQGEAPRDPGDTQVTGLYEDANPWITVTSPCDEEQAHKIAVEERQDWLRYVNPKTRT